MRDSEVSYYIRGTSRGESLFPVDDLNHPSSEVVQFFLYEDAADAWNDINAGVSMVRTNASQIADLWIVGYWDPYLTTPPKPSDGTCGTSVACVKNTPRHGTIAGYPNLGHQTMYVEELPRRGIDASKMLTTDFAKATGPTSLFLNLCPPY